MEDVDYEVHEVEQYPSALLNTFDMVYPYAFLLELGDEMLTDGTDVRIGCPARNHEVFGHVGDAAEVEQHDVVCFHVQT